MKSKKILFSIIVGICSVLCSFGLFNKTSNQTVSAAQNVSCYTMVLDENFDTQNNTTTYVANTSVGKASGDGKYTLDTKDLILTAEANANYQIVGWKVVYNEQENKTIFINTKDLVNGSKTLQLTSKDDVFEVKVNVSFSNTTQQKSIFTKSTFKLEKVFENLTVTPVFDQVYYQLKVPQHALFKTYNEPIDLSEDEQLFYKSSSIDADTQIKTYTDVIIVSKTSGVSYYGTLHCKDGKYYTVHNTLEDTPKQRMVEYTKGAFIVNQNIQTEVELKIESELSDSANINVVGVKIESGKNESVSLSQVTQSTDVGYMVSSDDWKRTTKINLNFNIINSQTATNTLNVLYHMLYAVTLNFKVDGEDASATQMEEIYGVTNATANKIEGNISLINYYSKNRENTQFLVRKASDNGNASFDVTCNEKIGKYINGKPYTYYRFDSLDGNKALKQIYANINANRIITIEYLTQKYKLEFQCIELEEFGTNKTFSKLDVDSLSGIDMVRGEEKILTEADLVAADVFGYEFVGYSVSDNIDDIDSAAKNFTFVMNDSTPEDTTIYVIYKKISYSIKFTNYNKDGKEAMQSIGFNITNVKEREQSRAFSQTDLSDNAMIDTGLYIKVGGHLEIPFKKNPGFNIIGFSCKPTISSDDDYFENNKLDFSEEFIENNLTNLTGNVLTIYVFEEVEKYTITYKIDPTLDSKIGDNGQEVIMANISAEKVNAIAGEIVRYNINGDVATGSDTVVKIVISNIGYGEIVTLKSETKSSGEGEDMYYYMFNRFTADNVTDLSKELTETTIDDKKVVTIAQHKEVAMMSKTITVVYSMPETKLKVQADEETMASANFKLDVDVMQEDVSIAPVAGEYKIESNDFTVKVGSVFGFNLIGYYFNNVHYTVEVGTNSIDITNDQVIADYQNNLVLNFQKLGYQFQFKQHGAGDEFVMFGSNNFTSITIDTDDAELSTEDKNLVSLKIEKPEGYYVENITFGNDGTKYNSAEIETNDLRNYLNRNEFTFQISVDDFEALIINKSNQEDDVIKVMVHLYYELYTYTVQLNRKITNSQGRNDLNVQLPTFKAINVTNNKDLSVQYKEDSLLFMNIPYGIDIKIELVSEPIKGMGKIGYKIAGTYYMPYSVNNDELIVTGIVNDGVFDYEIYYLPVKIGIEVIGKGDASVLINNNVSSSILLFNKLEIKAHGNTNLGFVFKQISYNEVSYSEYQHSEKSWNELKNKLYILKENGQYCLNSDENYNSELKYFTQEINEQIITSADVESDTVLSVNSFDFDRFLITESENNQLEIVFVVEFKLLEMTIENTIIEDDRNGKLSEAGVYDGKSMLKFNVDKFATFKVLKTDENGVQSDISTEGFVTYNDSVYIEIQINSNAINLIDGKEYDLSIGLKLNQIKIYTTDLAHPEISQGLYYCQFEVKNHFANFIYDGQLEIKYAFLVKKFTLESTTIVKDSTEFYNNVTLNIDAKTYGFAEASKSSENEVNVATVVLSQDLQYLSSGKTYVNLSNTYKQDFIIYGVNAYLNGIKLSESDFGKYSIQALTGEGNENCYTFQMFGDLKIEFLIRPNITFNNGGPAYEKQFSYDAKGYAKGQALTVGSTAKQDIQVSSLLADFIELTYEKDGKTTSVIKNAGKYNVDIGFNMQSGHKYEWLKKIVIEDEITVEILKKEISLSYDKQAIEQATKIYDGNSDYPVENVYDWLLITDGKNFKIKFSEAVADKRFSMTEIDSFISTSGKDGEVKDADETKHYNFYLYGFALSNNEFNNNYHMLNDDLIIENYIQITRAPLQIQNLQVYSKVYDGTTKAELVEGVKLGILGIIPGDDISLNDLNNIVLSFEDETVGTNKKVVVDASNAIGGESAHNYYVASTNVEGLTIYPYKLTVEVEGRGTVELINERGLTDKELVDLIPLGAKLEVVAFKKDSKPYVNIYSKIRSKVRGRNEFVVGYQIAMSDSDGTKIPINNNLFLSVPSIKDLTGAFYLTENKTGEVTATKQEKNLLIDLEPINGNVDYVFLIHRKTMLKPWQIVLIVIGSVVVVGGGVVAFILIRKFKKGRDSVHEKI